MKKRYNLGLVSVSFRNRTPLEILTQMKKADLSFIEWGSDVHAPCSDKEKLLDIARLQNEFGIVCSSYGTYFRFLETPITELISYIDAAKILGTDVLRLWCGKKSGAQMTESEKEALLAECLTAARIAEKQGVTSVYTITTDKSVVLEYHDVLRRLYDGKIFRITSDGDDKYTPDSATLNMRQVTAEEWSLPT